ncbi:MAG: mevalonate kinase [Candidatus Methanomethylophilaceae archaeon]|jgi:mevalonate kinase|nr:mevalonate kinase [Candidatus Methanomethylophilaceae archaeon]NCA73352.1 mevalonate kinase [Gammaproteobacteria bacterium]MDD2936103.1 mevalonate kinase [Candidatus Methanomethylophilaceae archaeon]MDD3351003.1 mevalonate kinase [Candidatus Methanomethylophilaceae archaeon]MDD3986395.1 mevalonate kinase [Candidatus Methanomethylophilaceae archaeon]
MRSASASAPGKFVVLGEHAVVYGKPAVALAIDRRFRCTVSDSDRLLLNGMPEDLSLHPHMRHVLKANGVDSISIVTESDLPSGSGLGSSAALSAALSCAVRTMLGRPADEKDIINEAYEAEFGAQGIGSPMDTSASVHGGGIGVNIPCEGEPLWTIERNGNRWNVCDVHAPEMTFVVGYTGIKALTGPLVEKVRRYKDRNSFAKDIVEEIGSVTLEGADALRRNDRVKLGRLMTADHKLLSILGVSSPELNRLVDAAAEYSYGSKLTGAGGGGSMIALTDRPEKVCETIRLHGGNPMIVKTGVPGVTAGDKI